MKKRISVAMATYNGAKYVEKQLRSILEQATPPDEIIISDDGSRDETLQIVRKIVEECSGCGTEIKILTDNPRHGYCGNFEWAIKHTTGDYIFLCDQDDVWMPEKTAEVVGVFERNPSAQCVFHHAVLINESDEQFAGKFGNIRYNFDKLKFISDDVAKLEQDVFLERTVSGPIANGMVMCISRELLSVAMPFPRIHGLHDQWLAFCSVYVDQCYYLNRALSQYRIHGENETGVKEYKGSIFIRIQKIMKRLSRISINSAFARLGAAMMQKLEERNMTDTPAYVTATSVRDIGERQMDAARSGRITGALKLTKLYCMSMRYRRSGTSAFLYQLASILLHSKKARCAVLDQ